MKKLLVCLIGFTALSNAESYLGGNVGGLIQNNSQTMGYFVDMNYGYQFNENLALDFVAGVGNRQDAWGTKQDYIGAVTAKGILPVSHDFSLYGKLGIGGNYATINQITPKSDEGYNGDKFGTSLVVATGAGIEYKYDDKVTYGFGYNGYIPVAGTSFGTIHTVMFNSFYSF